MHAGQWIAVLWRREGNKPHARPGPWPYQITGQFNGYAVIDSYVLTDVSRASDPEKNLVWLLEGVPDGCTVNDSFGLDCPEGVR